MGRYSYNGTNKEQSAVGRESDTQEDSKMINTSTHSAMKYDARQDIT